MSKYNALDMAVDAAKEWLGGLDKSPVAATVDIETLRSRLGVALESNGNSVFHIKRQPLSTVIGFKNLCLSNRHRRRKV